MEIERPVLSVGMMIKRHVLPAGLGAAVAVGVSEYGALAGKAFFTGLRALPSAGLGAVAGIFYSATYDMLPAKTGFRNLAHHAIALLTSAVLTYGVTFAAATAGVIAMPTLTSLGALFAAAVLSNMLFRAIFGGSHPRKEPEVKPAPPTKPPTEPTPAKPISAPKPISPPAAKLSKPRTIPKVAASAPKIVAPPPIPEAPPAAPSPCIWPSDLNDIGIYSWDPGTKKELDEYLRVAVEDIMTTGVIPPIRRKNDLFAFNGKLWKLPRTVTFIEDPKTKKLAAILLSVSTMRVPALGKGKDRTAKVIYDLLTGQRMVKKAANKDDPDAEIALLQTLNGSKGIEPLIHIRKVRDKRTYSEKTQLITPLFKGTVDKLLASNPTLSAKDIRNMMLSLLTGLEKLHALPGKTKGFNPRSFRSYHSDIKPANLLYDKTSAGYDAVVSDMETVNKVDELWATMAWMSPRKLKQWYRLEAHLDNADYNMQNSQHDDIWSMGLVFASLLKNKLHQGVRWKGIAPLACIYQKLELNNNDSNIATIKQHELDDEIRQNKAATALNPDGSAKEKMWDIVQRMLAVQSNRRYTAKEAREALEVVIV